MQLFLLGVWGVGLATRTSDLNEAPGGNDSESWVFCHDGVYRHNKKEIQSITKYPVEGDVIVSILSIIYQIIIERNTYISDIKNY